MLDVLRHTVMITGFVFVMMLVIEYLNVLTRGVWQSRISKNLWGQYLLAAALGAVPGCLGAFAAVAMYSHGFLSIGAVIASMVATMGDEAFVLLALEPGGGVAVISGLFALGIGVGALTDLATRKFEHMDKLCCQGFEVHEEFVGSYFPRGEILQQWRECKPARGMLAVILVALIIGIIWGQIGHHDLDHLGHSVHIEEIEHDHEEEHDHDTEHDAGGWNWIRITMLVTALIALFIVATVSDHFLEEHLWVHIAKEHLPRIFLWTLGALAIIYFLTDYLHLDIESMAREGKWIFLLVACLVGLIPQSGPHMVFVTLFASGTVPLGVLLGNAIVQDGHGMLPLLAYSRRTFFVVKAIKFIIGMGVGALALSGLF
jgi:hypothetical protein